MYYHPTENRYLTTREAASLQSFPLDFEFCGNITSQWTQIGNAVPFRMAFEIAKCLKEMLKDKKKITNKDISLGSNNIETVRSLYLTQIPLAFYLWLFLLRNRNPRVLLKYFLCSLYI